MSRVAAIRAIFVRDLRIQLTYPFGFVSQFAGIVISVFSFFFLGKLVGSSPLLDGFSGGYFEFALVGIVVIVLAAAGLSAFNKGLSSESGRGTLEILLASPTRLYLLVTGWMLWPLALAALEGTLTLGIGWVVSEGGFRITGLLLALLPLVLTVATFLAVGLISGAFSVLTKRGDPITPLYLSASTLLAGAIYPVDVLPAWLAEVGALLPAFYGFNAIRDVLIGNGGFGDIASDVLILVAFNLLLLPLGMWLLSRALRIGRITGTLGA